MRQKSIELFKKAEGLIPGGVNSPVRAFRSVGGTPVFMARGSGAELIDVDGNRYLDFNSSWGPLITGHCHPDIIAAIHAQVDRALTFGTPTELEVELALYILDRLEVPGMEQIRFVSSGTEAVMSALRLARGFTSRTHILKFAGCYHGHVDALLVKAGSGLATAGIPDSAGIPESVSKMTVVVELDDEEALEQAFNEYGERLAAAIIEPVPANNGLLLQRPEFLKKLQSLCKKYGTLFILDEVISGFRLGFSGAARHYDLSPDIVTYGKIIGGGLPVGAFASRKEIFASLAPMGPVYQAGTLSGNPVAMAAGLASLKLLTKEVYDHLEDLGRTLDQSSGDWKLLRLGSIFWLYRGHLPRRASQIDPAGIAAYPELFHRLLDAGIYLAPSGYEVGFLSAPMQKSDIERFIKVLGESA